jgi:exodeoxyribonuclease VII small subunit
VVSSFFLPVSRQRGKTMAKKTFESALTKLEQLTSEIEQGELALEDSLKKFDEAIGLVRFCNEKLEDARTRVDLLLSKDGALDTVPFAEEDEGGD